MRRDAGTAVRWTGSGGSNQALFIDVDKNLLGSDRYKTVFRRDLHQGNDAEGEQMVICEQRIKQEPE